MIDQDDEQHTVLHRFGCWNNMTTYNNRLANTSTTSNGIIIRPLQIGGSLENRVKKQREAFFSFSIKPFWLLYRKQGSSARISDSPEVRLWIPESRRPGWGLAKFFFFPFSESVDIARKGKALQKTKEIRQGSSEEIRKIVEESQ